MASSQRIVVVGGLSETEQVLKAVLEPRGVHVERIRDGEFGAAQSSVVPPRLVVYHDDDEYSAPTRVCLERWEEVPHVIIGSAEVDSSAAASQNGQFLQNPFQYRELIQAIEHLLRDNSSQSRAA